MEEQPHKNGKLPSSEKQLVEQLDQLTIVTELLARKVEQLQQWHPLLGNFRRLVWRGFVYGMSHGLGYAVGTTLIVGLLIWVLGKLQVIPILGEWITQLREAIQHSP